MWAALPGVEAPAGAYIIQRWPTAAMPSPGQASYLSSVLHLQPPNFDASEGTYSATDSLPAAAGSPFYRVLALAPSGLPVAATRPSQAAVSKGGWYHLTSPSLYGSGSQGLRAVLLRGPRRRRPLTARHLTHANPTVSSPFGTRSSAICTLHNAGSVFVSSRPCGGGPCRRLLQQRTIQAAIDAAAPGSIVNILPGDAGEGNMSACAARRRAAAAAAAAAACAACPCSLPPTSHPCTTTAGTYRGAGNTNLSFGGKRITLQATGGPEATTIDCQGAARGFLFTAADSPATMVKGA